MMMFDPLWIVLALPGLLLGMWATFKVRSAYQRASQIPSLRGRTGADVAREILASEEIRDVAVEPTQGLLTDHYHPVARALRLSEESYHGDSLAAVGVSAHEVGHAIQHARGYFPMTVRSALVPISQAGSILSQIGILGGLLMMAIAPALGHALLGWAILGYAAVFLFTLVTLPVEFNASRRALRVLAEQGLVDDNELPEVKRVLDAAALTYVAGAASVLGALLYAVTLYGRTSEE